MNQILSLEEVVTDPEEGLMSDLPGGSALGTEVPTVSLVMRDIDSIDPIENPDAEFDADADFANYLDPLVAEQLHKNPNVWLVTTFIYISSSCLISIMFFGSGTYLEVLFDARYYIAYYLPLVIIPCVRILMGKIYILPEHPTDRQARGLFDLIRLIVSITIFATAFVVIIGGLATWQCANQTPELPAKGTNCSGWNKLFIILFTFTYVPPLMIESASFVCTLGSLKEIFDAVRI